MCHRIRMLLRLLHTYLSRASTSPRAISKRRSEDLGHGVANICSNKARLASNLRPSTDFSKTQMASASDQVLNARTRAQEVVHGSTAMVSRNGLCGEIGTHAFVVGMSSFKFFHFIFEEMGADDLLYLCACDRQGIIRTSGISIIADSPQFLVCLLSFHRDSVIQCGVPCHANISCEKHPTFDHTKSLSSPVEEIEWKNPPETAHDEMAHTVKTIDHEIQRPPEINPVGVHYAVFGRYELSPFNNLPASPSLHVSVNLQARNTPREQSARGIRGKRDRVLRVGGVGTGKSFIDAWLDAVTCTLFYGLIAMSD